VTWVRMRRTFVKRKCPRHKKIQNHGKVIFGTFLCLEVIFCYRYYGWSQAT
jgi:hypothetical protein